MLKRKLCSSILKLFAVAAGILVLLDLMIVSLGWCGYWVNATNSMPVGLYKEDSGNIEKKSYVLLCKDDYQLSRKKSDDYFCKDGHQPILKTVVAARNDVVSISDKGVYVNSLKLRNSERLANSMLIKNGSQLTDYRLKENEFLVMGRSPYSWDSRYFGIVKRDEVVSKVVPVFVFFTQYEDFDFNH